jgi:hypothetical protein
MLENGSKTLTIIGMIFEIRPKEIRLELLKYPDIFSQANIQTLLE